MNKMTLRIALLTLVFSFALTGFSQTEQPTMDGKTFVVKIKEQNASGKIDKWEDEISFEAGKIRSGFSVKNSFDHGPYVLMLDSGSAAGMYTFSATSINPIGETLKWQGTIRGNVIQGQAERSDTGTIYFFKGKLK